MRNCFPKGDFTVSIFNIYVLIIILILASISLTSSFTYGSTTSTKNDDTQEVKITIEPR